MSESGEDARLQRFIERERMGLNDEAKARIRELERVVAEKNARIKELKEIVSGKTMYDAAEAERERIKARIEALAETFDQAARAQTDEFGNYVSSPTGPSGDYKEGKADAFDLAAQQVRAALVG